MVVLWRKGKYELTFWIRTEKEKENEKVKKRPCKVVTKADF